MAAIPTVLSKIQESIFIPAEYTTVTERRCRDVPDDPPPPDQPVPPPDEDNSGGTNCRLVITGQLIAFEGENVNLYGMIVVGSESFDWGVDPDTGQHVRGTIYTVARRVCE